MRPEIDPLMTTRDVATLSGRSERAIRVATHRGKVPGVVRPKGTRIVRYRSSAIRAWLNPRSNLRDGKGRTSTSE